MRILVAPLAALLLIIGLGTLLGGLLTASLVREDARFVGISTSGFVHRMVPDLETILDKGVLDAEQRVALQLAAGRSRVVSFALLDREGRTVVGGREVLPGAPPAMVDDGTLRALFASVLASGDVRAVVRPAGSAGWPPQVGDAMVPIERDGRLIGAMHVAIDLTDKVATYRRTFGWAVMVMTALFVLAAIVPGAFVWRRLKALEVAEAKVRHLAFHDALTGLPNRLLFNDRLAQAIAGVRREGGHGALMLLDVDEFKAINDALGHTGGDHVLRTLAGRLAASVREVDTVARLGGDEFAIVVARLARAEDLDAIVARVSRGLLEPLTIDGRSVGVGMTAGVVLFPDQADEADRLTRLADAALYRGKREARGTVTRHGWPSGAGTMP